MSDSQDALFRDLMAALGRKLTLETVNQFLLRSLKAGGCSDMFIRKLRPGERAPEKTDRICIDRLKSGRISWIGLLDAGRKAVRAASPLDFATVQEAETDAIAWARGHGAKELQIEGPSI